MSDYMIGELPWKGSLNEERVSLRKGVWRENICCSSASFQYLHRGVVSVTTVSGDDEVGIMSKVTLVARLRSCQNDSLWGELGRVRSGPTWSKHSRVPSSRPQQRQQCESTSPTPLDSTPHAF
jgi:hypothetical protein